MKTKAVILFIVEGAGDITSDLYSKPSNIVSKINTHVKYFMHTNGLGIRKKDIRQVIHLIDTD
jgi:hypothetical protein